MEYGYGVWGIRKTIFNILHQDLGLEKKVGKMGTQAAEQGTETGEDVGLL
jgi:hypothetical protein